jgi:hypothetical protein
VTEVARRNSQNFDRAAWLHKAREMPREEFGREVEKELTGKEEEPSTLASGSLGIRSTEPSQVGLDRGLSEKSMGMTSECFEC